MSAADRLARLLQLVPWLVAHPGVTMRECALNFGVTEKQLEDDLYLLIVSGDGVLGADRLVDIQFWSDEDEDSDARFDASIRVVEAQALDRPMRLNASEAMALLVALRMLEQLPGLADRNAIASVVAKLEGATSSSTAPPAAGEIAVDVAVDPAVRAVLDDALAGGSELELTYGSATSGAVTVRQVIPYGVAAVDGIAYLDAFCRFAGARRTFRLDRVVTARAMPAGEEPPADDVSDGTDPVEPRGPLVPPRRTAVLDLAPSSRWVAETHGAQVISELDDGGVRVRVALHDLQWAVRLVLAQAGGARVVEPTELAEAVADAARAALAAYPGPLR